MPKSTKPKRSAIKIDLFANLTHTNKLDSLGDPLRDIDTLVDIKAISDAVEKTLPQVDYSKGGRPPYPTETIIRIFLIKRLVYLKKHRIVAS